MMSSLPSPLTSPRYGNSPARQKKSFHFTVVPAKLAPVDTAAYTSASASHVNVTTSALPSPLTSPTRGSSPPTANRSCHCPDSPNDDPFDNATITSDAADGPCVNVTRSACPSPFTSPTAGYSPGIEKNSCHFVDAPNPAPVDNAT